MLIYQRVVLSMVMIGDDSRTRPLTAWGDLSFRLRVQPKDGPKSDWFAEFFRIRSPMAVVNSIMVYI